MVCDVGELPEYPLAANTRLTTHYFLTWHFDRWLHSRFRLTCHPEVGFYAFNLINLAQKQAPVGTLPEDDVELAALLGLDLQKWIDLRQRSPSPLYGWERCTCEGRVRLMHPVVLEMIEDGLERRERAQLAAGRAAVAKRQHRLREAIRGMGAQRVAADDLAIEWIDGWLEEHCKGNRTAGRIQEALEAHSTREVGA